MKIRIKSPFWAVLCALAFGLWACEPIGRALSQPSVSEPMSSSAASGAGLSSAQAPYSGRKATIAIAAVEGTQLIPQGWRGAAVEPDLENMWITALMKSGRFRVVSRSQIKSVLQEQDLATAGRIGKSTQVKSGEITGADLQLKAKITGFDPGYESVNAAVAAFGRGFGGWLGAALSLAGSVRQSRIVFDIVIIDMRTSEAVLSFPVEGVSTDLGGGIGGGGGSVAAAVSAWKNTPMEKAARVAVESAVPYFSQLPQSYFKH